ncbi:unnamed protein product [Rotaria sp. Silwood1]|nr:unnamed protein product [Rotaria sp. Silwood1]CAF4742867.1 unnamed protein product [Rotaria sp. Silwood1]
MSLLYGETECFHLPTESKGTACRPLILNTSSIYINIQCQNEWYDCPLQYRIETQCVPRPNIRKRQTLDVRIDRTNFFASKEPKFNATVNISSNRIAIKHVDHAYHGDYPSFVYAVYHKPIYHDRNDSWLFRVKTLHINDKPENDDSTPIKIVFGFITDKFPMDYTSGIGWHTISYAYNHSVLWIKRHTGYYCIDGEETKWQGTLTGDDGHYRAVVGFENVGRNDRIQIDVRKMTDVKTDKISTQINVLKNNQTTKVTNFYLPKPVPKQLYPGEMNLIDLL